MKCLNLLYSLLLLTFLSSLTAAQAGLDTALHYNLRYSITPETIRVVVDLPRDAEYSPQLSPKLITTSIALPMGNELPAIAIKDAIISKLSLAPDEAGMAKLSITLAAARKANVFMLSARDNKPARLVVDIYKCYRKETSEKISPAINYFRMERQNEHGCLVTHVLQVNTRDPQLRMQVVAAKDGGETVGAMTIANNALCGINGGYFIGGTRPVGLLQISEQILSMPLWSRSALAIPEKGLPVVINPTGYWRIQLADGTVHEFADWLDSSLLQPAPAARLILGSSIGQAPANPNGVTVIIKNNIIIERPQEKRLLAVDEYALHLTGDIAKELAEKLTVGAQVIITPIISPALSQFAYAVGAGPRLLAAGKIKITDIAENIPSDIRNGARARTAVGMGADGLLVAVIVEAPDEYGGGATLQQLAEIIKAYGAREAINLDGGSSSTLAIGKSIRNISAQYQRQVADSILFFDLPTRKN